MVLAAGSIVGGACAGNTPAPQLPPPDYERPTLTAWRTDAGTPDSTASEQPSTREAAPEADAGDY